MYVCGAARHQTTCIVNLSISVADRPETSLKEGIVAGDKIQSPDPHFLTMLLQDEGQTHETH